MEHNRRGDYDDGELNDGGHFHGGYDGDEICGLYGLLYGGHYGDGDDLNRVDYVSQRASLYIQFIL